MFLRKLTVMAVPLLLCAAVCMLLPLLSGLGYWSNVLKGGALGAALALLLPVSGAGRKREPFAGLLWAPAVLLMLVIVYQYLHSVGAVRIPLVEMLATRDGQVVLVESIFAAYMGVQCIRTRK